MLYTKISISFQKFVSSKSPSSPAIPAKLNVNAHILNALPSLIAFCSIKLFSFLALSCSNIKSNQYILKPFSSNVRAISIEKYSRVSTPPLNIIIYFIVF